MDGGSIKWKGYVILIAILLSTGWSLWSTVNRRLSVPTRATWQRAVTHVQAALKPHDRVTWYPEWAGEARLAMHGLPTLILPHQGTVDLAEAKRLWVIGGFGYDGQVLADGTHLQPIQKLKVISHEILTAKHSGAVSITLLDVQGEQVTHSLFDDLDDSNKVSIDRTRTKALKTSTAQPCNFWALNGWHCTPISSQAREKVRHCLSRPQAKQLKQRKKRRDLYTLDRRRWLPYVDCNLHPTEHISKDWRVIDETPRRCLSIAPHRNQKTYIKWSIDASTQTRQIWFSYGWEDLAVRHPFRSSKAKPIRLTIQKGIKTIFSEDLHPSQGWFLKQFNIAPSNLMGPPAPITLSYTAPHGVEDATFCISLDVRSPL